jgi:hypothetical protein
MRRKREPPRQIAKRRAVPKAVRPRNFATAGNETEVARLTRELNEASERQTATAELLNLIASSPNEAQPVFDMIAKSTRRLCKAQFCYVFHGLSAPSRTHVGGDALNPYWRH